jgi:2-alkyl-3-oxoalkanoate reductase
MARILITGSSGFIGRHLVRGFRERGWEVIGLGRRRIDEEGYRSHDLSLPLPRDLHQNFDVVVHAAARSSPWGSKREFQRDNLQATKNVIDYCEKIGLPHLIYISSSSIYYRPEHQLQITESTPIPKRFVNRYAATKYQSELMVNAYRGSSCILRPRAVFGPGDTILLPRIVAAAQSGRLPLIVDKAAPVIGDLIYVQNVVDATIVAAEKRVCGEFNLTNDEPVEINAFLNQALRMLSVPAPSRRVSAAKAMLFATGLELLHTLFLPRKEPAITRFGVHVFRYSKTFDISKAKRVLGAPRISLVQGLNETIESMLATKPLAPP